MLRLALSRLRIHPRRFIAVTIAVLLAVAFLMATMILKSSTDATLQASLGATYKNADAIMSVDGAGSQEGVQGLTQPALEAVASVPGVKATYGVSTTSVEVLTSKNSMYATLRNLPTDEALNILTYEEGTGPRGPNEVSLDPRSAEDLSTSVGQEIKITGPGGKAIPVKVTGIVKPTADPFTAGVGQLYATTETVKNVIQTPLKYDMIQLKLGGPLTGAQRTELSNAATSAGTKAVTVRTTEEEVAERMKKFSASSTGLNTVLLMFVAIALLVAGLVVTNTFAVLVTQRMREIGLLRCVGAMRKQIWRAVIVEAAIVGLIASLLGIALTVGGMSGLFAYLKSQGNLAATMTFPLEAPLIAIAVGVLLTVLAAFAPAKEATTVTPLAALHPLDGTNVRTRKGRIRLIAGGLCLLLGVPVLALGASQRELTLSFLAGALTFVGVLLCSSAFIPRLIAGAAALASGAGVPAKLAGRNAMRNPGRTTATAAALLIGVTLVSTIMVGASVVRASLDGMLDDYGPVDVMTREGDFTGNQVEQIRAIGGVKSAALLPVVGTLAIEHEGTAPYEGSSNRPIFGISEQDANDMFDNPQNRPRPGTLLSPQEAGPQKETVTIETSNGNRELPVVRGTNHYGESIVSLNTLPAPPGAQSAIWVSFTPGLNGDESRKAVDEIAQVLGVKASSLTGSAMFKAMVNQVINTLMMIVIGLLAVAILIAIVGVANTLSLSVLERTQENALLRALGLTRASLRGMLALEAVLTALVAALLGVMLGTIYGWIGASAAVKSIGATFTVVPTIPWSQLVLVLAISIVAGLAASVFPAQRAAKTPPVVGLAAE